MLLRGVLQLLTESVISNKIDKNMPLKLYFFINSLQNCNDLLLFNALLQRTIALFIIFCFPNV